MKSFVLLAALVGAAVASPVSQVFEVDISPEEAQRYIDNPPFLEPQLSAKTATLPLVRWNDPRFRSGEGGPTNGHYWKNGHEIENTDDYVEEVYDASQFHGQDGLGKYAYGYSAPESAKVENRERSGDVKGSYSYRDGNDQLIQVRYWADSEGFHQEDNLPKVELQPAQETPEVREARLAHEKAWQEAAEAARANPDPEASNDQYDTSASEHQNVIADTRRVQPHQTSQHRIVGNVTPAQSQQYQTSQQNVAEVRQAKAYDSQYSQGQYSQHSNQYSQQGSQNNQIGHHNAADGQPEDAEPTGPPRGFFYSFTYPVSVLINKNAQGHDQGQGQLQGSPIDHDTVGVSAQAHYG